MTNLSEFTFLSSDGKTQLHGMLWEPEAVPVRAVLQVCHGVAEHIARYDGFARALSEQGIAVAGHDRQATASRCRRTAPRLFRRRQHLEHGGGRHLRAAPAAEAALS